LGARLLLEDHGPVRHLRLARTWLGRPAFWTGAYIVDGLLVDCGPPALAHAVEQLLESEPLVGLVLTHHHEDHVGAAALLARRRGLTPRIHPVGLARVRDGFTIELYRRYAWGRPGPAPVAPLGGAVRGRTLAFEVVPTPGHTDDHVCLFQPERGWLFTGDLFLSERLRYLRHDEDLTGLVASLEKVAQLPVREVFCAHRGRIAEGPAALARKAAWLKELRERIRERLGAGEEEAAIARRLVGPEGLVTWLSRGHFSARNFVRAVARGAAAPTVPEADP